MSGEKDLTQLLRGMAPELFPEPYVFEVLAAGDRPGVAPFATIAEEEGLTLVRPAVEAGEPLWARISLTIQSDLGAVGLTAAFSGALAAEGISANVIAGYHHDHLFVPWDRRHDALTALLALAEGVADV